MQLSKHTHRRGVTLIELMIATGIGSVLLVAVMSLTFYSARSFAAIGNYIDLEAQNRKTLNRLTQEIRQADAVKLCNATDLVLSCNYPGATNTYTLAYTYDPGKKTLTRTLDSEAQVLLTQCDFIEWNMYQRNMTNKTDQPIPTTDVNECKLIKLTWVCSRNIFGKTANTESVQSAEIMIRKK
jgi:prepilin-type N-terminal cleavage/methylation domain-containing protein